MFPRTIIVKMYRNCSPTRLKSAIRHDILVETRGINLANPVRGGILDMFSIKDFQIKYHA